MFFKACQIVELETVPWGCKYVEKINSIPFSVKTGQKHKARTDTPIDSKEGFLSIYKLEITLPDFTVLPFKDVGKKPYILECVPQAYSILIHFALFMLNRASLLSCGRISRNLMIYKNALC